MKPARSQLEAPGHSHILRRAAAQERAILRKQHAEQEKFKESRAYLESMADHPCDEVLEAKREERVY